MQLSRTRTTTTPKSRQRTSWLLLLLTDHSAQRELPLLGLTRIYSFRHNCRLPPSSSYARKQQTTPFCCSVPEKGRRGAMVRFRIAL